MTRISSSERAECFLIRVALIYGGEGHEHDISVASADNLSKLIDAEMYSIIYIFIDKCGNWYIHGKNDKHLTPTYPVRLDGVSGFFTEGDILPVDLAIPCLHGDLGEDGVIAGALTAAHIKYIGQDTFTSAFTSDKAASKLAAEHLGIPTARWLISSECGTDIKAAAEERIGYPMFIKPSRLGSSYGAHPVFDPRDFDAAYSDARSLSSVVLIEEYIRFEYEVECAYFEGEEKLFSPHGRILSGDFYDFFAKYTDTKDRTDTSCGYDPSVEEKIREHSSRLVELLGIRHLSRMDFFVTAAGDVYFNEINSFPGMTKTSLYPVLCEGMGQRKGEFINILIERALNDRRL